MSDYGQAWQWVGPRALSDEKKNVKKKKTGSIELVSVEARKQSDKGGLDTQYQHAHICFN